MLGRVILTRNKCGSFFSNAMEAPGPEFVLSHQSPSPFDVSNVAKLDPTLEQATVRIEVRTLLRSQLGKSLVLISCT